MIKDDVKVSILEYIKGKIKSEGLEDNFEHWYVGVTNDLERRKKEHKEHDCDTKHWKPFKTNSKEEADSIEDTLIEVFGLTGSPGGTVETSTSMYVFYDEHMKEHKEEYTDVGK